jgi:hypothetical protein
MPIVGLTLGIIAIVISAVLLNAVLRYCQVRAAGWDSRFSCHFDFHASAVEGNTTAS